MRKKLALLVSFALLAGLMTVPAFAVGETIDDPDVPLTGEPSASRDDTVETDLPDPNNPDSPDYVMIDDEDVPLGYVKIEDPDNAGQYIYIPEEDVPLGELPDEADSTQAGNSGGGNTGVTSPQTGTASVDAVLAVTGVLCAAGFAAVSASKKKAAG